MRPAEALAEKRPKDEHGWDVRLEPTTDVLRTLGERRRNDQERRNAGRKEGKGATHGG